MHVITGLGVGGAETMLTRLVTARRADTPRQLVVSLTRGGALSPRLTDAGIETVHLGMRQGVPDPYGIVRLVRQIRRFRPHVIQSWMYHADLMALLALYLSGRRRRTKLYWGVRCSFMDTSLYPPLLRLTIRACAYLSPLADGIVANSETGRSAHMQLGYRSSRFEVIDNGLEMPLDPTGGESSAELRRTLRIPPEVPVAALVARVDAMKDHATFLAALERFPGIVGIVAGKGTEALPERPNLHRLGLREDLSDVYAASDFVVLTSAFGEGFPNVLVEGMAAGLIPVSTDVGDARRIIGDTGIIVPPRNPAALADAMRDLVAETPRQHKDRSLRARQRVHDHFSLEQCVSSFDALYRKATSEDVRHRRAD